MNMNTNTNRGMTLCGNDWSPVLFKREFERLFDDWLTPSYREVRSGYAFTPACEVEEQDDHYLLSLDMPGVKRDDIQLEVLENQVVVSGERRNESTRKEGA